jgi:hypothetical protein
MIPSSSCNAESGEPSSYRQIEQALSKAASKPGGGTREVDSGAKELFVQGARVQSKPNQSDSDQGGKLSNEETACTGELVDQSRKIGVNHSLDSQEDHSTPRMEAADALVKTIKTGADSSWWLGSERPLSNDSMSNESGGKQSAGNDIGDSKIGFASASSESLNHDEGASVEPGCSVIVTPEVRSKPNLSFESGGAVSNTANRSELHILFWFLMYRISFRNRVHRRFMPPLG